MCCFVIIFFLSFSFLASFFLNPCFLYQRYRKKLEEERNRLIDNAMKKNPEFKPPADFKKTKYSEKVWIPQEEFPHINFMGQLLGPRGNTLKKLEQDCGGVKVFIRGKGYVFVLFCFFLFFSFSSLILILILILSDFRTVKEGKSSNGPVPGEDEEMHCMISGDTEEQVKKAVKCKMLPFNFFVCVNPTLFSPSSDCGNS